METTVSFGFLQFLAQLLLKGLANAFGQPAAGARTSLSCSNTEPISTLARIKMIGNLWPLATHLPFINEREIWLGAATHDIGLDIHPGALWHAIDPNLDLERAKVGADLVLSGHVAGEALLTRPNPFTEGLTATGAPWRTNGRLLAIQLMQ